ncbi:MAG: universal stress protein [Kiloniellaceae bacterium]
MFKEILLPVDLGNPETQEKAVAAAVELAKAFGCRLHVMTIVPDFGESFVSSFFPVDYQEKAVEAASAQLHEFVKARVPETVPVQHIVAHGTIYGEIVAYAKKVAADLIVMASHRPELSDHLLSPNAAQVERHAACSVLVVRD